MAACAVSPVNTPTTIEPTTGTHALGFRGAMLTGYEFRIDDERVSRRVSFPEGEPVALDFIFSSQLLEQQCEIDGLENAPCPEVSGAAVSFQPIVLLDLAPAGSDYEPIIHDSGHDLHISQLTISLSELQPGLHCLLIVMVESSSGIEEWGFADHSGVGTIALEVGPVPDSEPKNHCRPPTTAPGNESHKFVEYEGLNCSPFVNLITRSEQALPDTPVTAVMPSCDYDNVLLPLAEDQPLQAVLIGGRPEVGYVQVPIDVESGVVRAIVVPMPLIEDRDPSPSLQSFVSRPLRLLP